MLWGRLLKGPHSSDAGPRVTTRLSPEPGLQPLLLGGSPTCRQVQAAGSSVLAASQWCLDSTLAHQLSFISEKEAYFLSQERLRVAASPPHTPTVDQPADRHPENGLYLRKLGK